MGYKYDRAQILDAAVEAVFDEGVGQLTFGRLAKRIGINDRTIVYYFPTKAAMITETLTVLGTRFQTVLEEAFGDQVLDHVEVVRQAWPVLTSPEADQVFRVYFEVVGLAAAGVEPFSSLAPILIDGWIDWLAPRIAGADAGARSAGATAAVALVDGLLLLRHTVGPTAAGVAAARLGID